MPKSLRPALSPIITTYNYTVGTLASPPDLFLVTHVLKFVSAWTAWLKTRQESPDNALCVKEFFDKLQAICLRFPAYDRPENAAHIKTLFSVIMLYIPWEYLPEEERRVRLKIILQNKEFRLRLWQQHLELLNQRLAQDPAAGLGMSSPVAMALLEYEDLRAELIALPLEQISVFFKCLPEIIQKMPTLYAQLSAEKKQAFLRYQLDQLGSSLHEIVKKVYKQFLSYNKQLSDEDALEMLEPLTKDPSVELSVRSRANFVVASIHIALHEKASAKPYLDTLRQSSWGLGKRKRREVVDFQNLCNHEVIPQSDAQQLITLLTQLNKDLKVYLSQRDLKGVLYSMGFFNTQLSEKKNALVEILRSDIDTHIANLRSGKQPENSASELVQRLNNAETQNNAFYRDYARRIDGVGKLGGDLRTAAKSLKKFIPETVAELDSPPGSRLNRD